MHTYKLTTKCHLCAYLYAMWLNVWDMGLAIHDSRGSQRKGTMSPFFTVFYIGASLSSMRSTSRLVGRFMPYPVHIGASQTSLEFTTVKSLSH